MIKIDREFLSRQLPKFSLLIFGLTATVGAFTGGLWAGIGIGFALIMFAAIWFIEWRMPRVETRIVFFILIVLGVCAALNLHSAQPGLSWFEWEKLVTIFLPLSLLWAPNVQKHAASPRLLMVLPLAVALGGLALGIELYLDGPLIKFLHGPSALVVQYNRGFSYLVILAFPAMAALAMTRRRQTIVPLMLILLIPASLTESRAAKLALIVGFITILAAHFLPKLTRGVLATLPILAVGWPFAAQRLFLDQHDRVERLPPSWLDRMEIWDYMSYRIIEHPWLGWGLGMGSHLSPAKPHGALYRFEVDPAAHPHNAAIQLWVELGIAGLIFGIIFALFTLHRAGKLPATLTPFALGAWAAAFCISMIAYNFWSDSLWAAFALTGFAFCLLAGQAHKLRF